MAKIILNAFSFFFVVFIALIAAPRPTAAIDLRETVKWKPRQYKSGTAFCNKWQSSCQGYKPGGGNIYYLSAVCEPGDDQGHNQNTEARVSCVFEKAETNQIVEKLGVQLV